MKTWIGLEAIPISTDEYREVYRSVFGYAPTSVMQGDGMTMRSGVSYIVSDIEMTGASSVKKSPDVSL